MRLPAKPAREYPILLGVDHIDALESIISPDQELVIITDHNVKQLYGNALTKILLERGFRVLLLSFQAGEESKNAKTKESLELEMLCHYCGRDVMIVALGGGVVGDIAGFIAATYLRGIQYIHMPTTLLAMVDSSIGGKTGINTLHGKNLLGAFWHPEAVISDLRFLKTLPRDQLINGLIEAIKIFLTCDQEQFFFLQEHLEELFIPDLAFLHKVILHAIELKARIVEQDERETSTRMILNFGHTIGHAIERVSHYTIMHGYAVALGILVELTISELLGICSAKDLDIVIDLFYRLNITPTLMSQLNPTHLLEATRQDKKRECDAVRYILLRRIGMIEHNKDTIVHPVEDATVIAALQKLQRRG